MEIEDCGEEIRERPRKKRATGSERTPKQISDVKAANAVSNARRALGSDRSLDQVAKVKAANTVSNPGRSKGSDRSFDQIAGVKVANTISNAQRPKGSDRSINQVIAVKKSNKVSRKQRKRAKQLKRWARFRDGQTDLEQRTMEGYELFKVGNLQGAYVVLRDAVKLIPGREKYRRRDMFSYFHVLYILGLCLRSLGDLQGAIKSLQEADTIAIIQHQETSLYGKPNEKIIPLSRSKV